MSKGPYCSAAACPRISNPALKDRVPAGDLSKDTSGYSWCNYCSKHLALMNWAHKHHWPSVRVQGKMRYAVSGDASGWFLSIVGANQDMITALHETLIEGKRAPLPAIEEEE